MERNAEQASRICMAYNNPRMGSLNTQYGRDSPRIQEDGRGDDASERRGLDAVVVNSIMLERTLS